MAATPASQWRSSEQELELPSGNVAVVRRPQLIAWIGQGEVPNPLRAAVVELAEQADVVQVSPEERIRALQWIVARCFVEPRVVVDREPGDGELHVSQLDDRDLLYLIDWAMGEVDQLDRFRDERPGDGDGAGGSTVGVQTVQPAGASA